VEEEEGPTTRDDADTAANDESANDKKSEDAAVTRKGRETQIAAMIASFNAAPAYQLYKTDEADEANEAEEENDNAKESGIRALGQKRPRPNGTNDDKGGNDDNGDLLPITNSILLSSGSDRYTSSDGTGGSVSSTSAVSALSFDPPGSRLAVAHRDGTIRYYDFSGMDAVKRTPFRVVDADVDDDGDGGRTMHGQDEGGCLREDAYRLIRHSHRHRSRR
jgi:hypothetical protein